MTRVVVAGVAGVGKTTVLQIIEERYGVKVVNFGTQMLDIARKNLGIGDRDQLRKLPVARQIEIQKEASVVIGKMHNVIIDTHMSIRSPDGYLPGLPEWVLRELKISAYYLIEADPVSILKRRKGDASRKRDDDTVETIQEHQNVNRYYAIAYSVYSGATVSFIENPDGDPGIAADRIVGGLKIASSR